MGLQPCVPSHPTDAGRKCEDTAPRRIPVGVAGRYFQARFWSKARRKTAFRPGPFSFSGATELFFGIYSRGKRWHRPGGSFCGSTVAWKREAKFVAVVLSQA